jgi:hypothetical protein
MINTLREVIDKVDKVDIQAKNQGYQLFLDNLRFCSGYQGYQGYQLFLGDILIDNPAIFTPIQERESFLTISIEREELSPLCQQKDLFKDAGQHRMRIISEA